jgi:hypothetical protein
MYWNDELETIRKTGRPAEIYRDEVSDEPLFGYINSFDTESGSHGDLVCITRLDTEKGYNGLSLVRLDGITRVRSGVDEEGMAENGLLIGSEFPKVPKLYMLSIFPALKQLQELFRCLTVYLKCQRGEIGVTGELLPRFGNVIAIREFRAGCVHPPTWILNPERVTRIDADGILERTVAGL